MTNREKYAKEILDIACNGRKIAVNKSGNVVSCNSITKCSNCIFYKGGTCNAKYLIRKWCEAEYVEKPALTQKEKAFLDLLKEKYKYIARDKDGRLCIYSDKPEKKFSYWLLTDNPNKAVELRKIFDIQFDFIKWEDEEPWSIEDLKKLEVENE